MYETPLHLLNDLPKTREAGLHFTEPSVVAFMNLIARTPDDKIMSIVDEMFVFYTSLTEKYRKELEKRDQERTFTAEEVKNILEGRR